jgi:thymidine phosphorylase
LVEISEEFGRKARAIVSDMNEPLGRFIGTGVEVVEARDMLRGDGGDERARAGCIRIAAAMLELGGVDDATTRAQRALADGSAYEKFIEMIEAQGASRAALEALAPDPRVDVVRAGTSGIVGAIDAVALGHVARKLTDRNSRAGIHLHARIGDPIAEGDALAEVYGDGVSAASIAGAFALRSTSLIR